MNECDGTFFGGAKAFSLQMLKKRSRDTALLNTAAAAVCLGALTEKAFRPTATSAAQAFISASAAA